MPIPQGYELTEEGKKYATYWQNYTPDANTPGKIVSNQGNQTMLGNKPLIQPIGGLQGTGNQQLLTDQKTNLKNTLDTQKDKELTRLDDILASRGISRSGAVGAGTAEISKNYADALASGNVNLDTQMKQLDLQQSNQDMMKKYYDELTKAKQLENKPTTSVIFKGGSSQAGYDSTAGKMSYDANINNMEEMPSSANNFKSKKAQKYTLY